MKNLLKWVKIKKKPVYISRIKISTIVQFEKKIRTIRTILGLQKKQSIQSVHLATLYLYSSLPHSPSTSLHFPFHSSLYSSFPPSPSSSFHFPFRSSLYSSFPRFHIPLLLPFTFPSEVPYIPLSTSTFLIPSQPFPFPLNILLSLPTFPVPISPLLYLSLSLPTISFPTYPLPSLSPP